MLTADPGVARRLLAMACVCAGGGERLPRTDRVERLLAEIASGAPLTATLCGARIEAGHQVRVMREAGEAHRRGMGRLALEAGVPVVWDGRFEVRANEPGLRVEPLQGLALRLSPNERRALKRLPPAARPALPAFRRGEIVTCPILAQTTLASARALTGERLAGACGLIAREQNLSCGSDGERALGALS
jgi:tRNA(Ile)-lysidine synthase